ncbi:MAG UNVERIFIED_CONTAM: ribosome-associated translation inhibitor RaiA [Planctomycetaceae bacterium]|jgi:ribosomal subunit interface protein
MQIKVNGQHISIGQSLRSYVEEKLQNMVARYFEHAIASDVHFVKDGNKIKCDIKVHEGTGRHDLTKSEALCDDIYSSFDIAVAKCEKQLRRYRSRLKDRHHRVKLSEGPAFDAMNYIIQPQREEDEVDIEKNPVIVAENAVYIENLTVSEAVMKMDLENLPAVMFKNTKNGRVNMVYYRSDGNIAWVDSPNA